MRNRLFAGPAAAAVAAILGGCAVLGGGRLIASSTIPPTKGVVQFRRTVKRVTLIELYVARLPDPESLNPPGYAYVAWVQQNREDAPRNVGVLTLGRDASAWLRTKTGLKDFAFFVTVEGSGDVPQPTGPPLLWFGRDDWSALSER